MVNIYSVYNHPSSTGIVFDEEGFGRSMAQQHFKDDADVNTIMARYSRTGLLVDPLSVNTSRKPQFGDFSTVCDFHQAQNIIAESYEMFDALPSNIRKRFNNDPSELLAFIEDEKNHDEAVSLGLIDVAAVSDDKKVDIPHQVTIDEALKQTGPAVQPPET